MSFPAQLFSGQGGQSQTEALRASARQARGEAAPATVEAELGRLGDILQTADEAAPMYADVPPGVRVDRFSQLLPDPDAIQPGQVYPLLQQLRNSGVGGGAAYTPVSRAESVDSPEQTLRGMAPGYGPEVTAYQLEREFGRLEDQPSWMNAREYAQGAMQLVDAGDATDESARFVMAPERYTYMQHGPGRTVDLLRGLREDPGEAMQYYDKSEGARLTRQDFNDPNYQRFSGFGPAFMQFMTPTSPIGRYLQISENYFPLGPAAAASDMRGNGLLGTARDAYGQSGAMDEFQRRFQLGENPIMDLPDRLVNDGQVETDDERTQRYLQREAEVSQLQGDLAPPLGQDMVRGWTGMELPPVAGDTTYAGLGMLDASGLISVPMDIARSAGQVGAREVARAITKAGASGTTTGLPGKASRSVLAELGSAARAFPGEGMGKLGARVAAYRGIPAEAYAKGLRPMSLFEAASRQAYQEAVPEVAFGGALSQALPAQRTWWDYATGARNLSDEEYEAQAEERARRREAAATKMENMERGRGRQQIAEEYLREGRDAAQRNLDSRRRSMEWPPAEYGSP